MPERGSPSPRGLGVQGGRVDTHRHGVGEVELDPLSGQLLHLVEEPIDSAGCLLLQVVHGGGPSAVMIALREVREDSWWPRSRGRRKRRLRRSTEWGSSAYLGRPGTRANLPKPRFPAVPRVDMRVHKGRKSSLTHSSVHHVLEVVGVHSPTACAERGRKSVDSSSLQGNSGETRGCDHVLTSHMPQVVPYDSAPGEFRDLPAKTFVMEGCP